MANDRKPGSSRTWADDNEERATLGNAAPTTGVFVGIVKNNIDPARRGRLQVWIPDLGGLESESSNWRAVSYAGPFSGSTGFPTETPTNVFNQVPHTYGMWFSSPDINNFVLVTFINGDPMRGYWFACIPSTVSHYMIPAMGSIGVACVEPGSDDGVSALRYPVAEYNQTLKPNNAYEKFPFNLKPVHTIQWAILYNQGLEKDSVRGTISSSSHRESPSRVFGISTPGRPVVEKTGITPEEKLIPTRKGGHTFVLDDGDSVGKDQLLRLRSAGGHQIMLNDSEKILYIANSEGTAWLEFDEAGKIHLYGKDSISLRTEKDFNLHTDKDINVHSYKDIKVYAAESISFESKLINIKATMALTIEGDPVTIQGNSHIIEEAARIDMNGPAAPHITAFTKPALGETIQTGKTWEHSATLATIVKILPTHEPSSTIHTKKLSGANGPIGSPGAAGPMASPAVISGAGVGATSGALAAGATSAAAAAAGSAASIAAAASTAIAAPGAAGAAALTAALDAGGSLVAASGAATGAIAGATAALGAATTAAGDLAAAAAGTAAGTAASLGNAMSSTGIGSIASLGGTALSQGVAFANNNNLGQVTSMVGPVTPTSLNSIVSTGISSVQNVLGPSASTSLGSALGPLGVCEACSTGFTAGLNRAGLGSALNAGNFSRASSIVSTMGNQTGAPDPNLLHLATGAAGYIRG